MEEEVNYNVHLQCIFIPKSYHTVILCNVHAKRVDERYKTRFVLQATILNLIVAYSPTKIN